MQEFSSCGLFFRLPGRSRTRPNPVPTPRILDLSFAPLHVDARVQRQIRALTQLAPVDVVAFGELGALADNQRVQMFPLEQARSQPLRSAVTLATLLAGKVHPATGYHAWYWARPEHRRAVELIEQLGPTLIVANDWNALPAAVVGAERSGARVVLDLHEYAPRHFENRRYWRVLIAPLVDYWLRRYLKRPVAVFSVCEGIRHEYLREYGVDSTVIMNAPDVSHCPPDPAPHDPTNVRLVHHGLAIPDRQLEDMVQAVGASHERFTLDLMLVDKVPGYIARLEALANRVAPGRVKLVPPVKPHEIVDAICEYDLGIFLVAPVNFNYTHILPNKFFEFVNAGLGVVIGPSIEMARLAKQYDFGAISPDFSIESFTETLNALTHERIEAMKAASRRAREQLNGNVEMGKLRRVVEAFL